MATSDSSTGQLRSRVHQQEVVAELGQQALESDDIDRLLRDAVVDVRETLEVDSCSVFELRAGTDGDGDGDGDSEGAAVVRPYRAGWRGHEHGSAVESTVSVDASPLVERALTADEPIVVEDHARLDGACQELVEHDITSSITVTIGSSTDPWGVLGVYTSDYREFTDHAVNFVTSVTNILASAIENDRAKRQRRQEEALTDRIVETSPVGIIVTDETGTIERANERAAAITGCDRTELTGTTYGDASWDPLDSEGNSLSESALPVFRVLETGEPVFDAEWNMRTADGDRIWISENAVPMVVDGDRTGVVVAFEDITEKRQRRQERQRIYRALETASEGISLLDEDGHFTYVNPAYADLYGYEPAEMVGEHWGMLYPDGEAEAVQDEIATQLEATGKWSGETTGLRRDGTQFVEDHYLATVGDGGSVCVVRDITDQRRVQAELQEERALKEQIVETSPVGITVTDADGRIQFANEQAEDIFGRSRDEITTFTHDDSRLELRDGDGDPIPNGETPFEQVQTSGEPVFDTELSLLRADGQRVWVTVNGAPLRSDEDVTGGVFTVQDITDQKRLENELEATFSRISDAFLGLDADWTITYANDRAETVIDAEGGLVGRTLWDAFPTAVDSRFEDAFRDAMDQQEPVSIEDYVPSLETWFEIHVYPSETGLSVYFRDVSERKEMEGELRETNQTLQRLYSVTADSSLSFDEKVEEVLALGCYRLGLENGFLAEIDEADDRFEITHAAAEGEDVHAGAEAPLSKTYCRRTIRSDGLLGFTDDPVDASIDEKAYETWGLDCYIGRTVTVDDDPYGTLCFVDEAPREGSFTPAERSFVELATQWVSHELERQRHQRELERFKEYTDDVLDAIDDVFYVVDETGELQRWNETLHTVAGYDDEEIESTHALEFFEGDDQERIADAIADAFRTGRTRVEATVTRSDGERVPYEFVASALEDPSGEPVLTGIGRDITERRENQRRLEQLVDDLAESNERLEQFAYAASHDLQEPLRMVSSYLQLLESRYGEDLDADAMEFIEFAVDGADRMREMIDGLLAYSRVDTQGDPFQPVELDVVLEDVLADLEMRIDETDADVTVADLPRVSGDPGQLRQLFQNLLDNAITYSGEDTPRISVFAEKEDTTWAISVRDHGIGIDPADTERIFQVFNRLHSREEYDGTGIGLALCQRIAERHGGSIRVDSEPGEGSTFSVQLPRSAREERDHE